jgi:hypothetical protein
LGNWDKRGRELWGAKGEREVYLGSRLAVQVVVPRLQERRLWQAMEIVDAVVRGKEEGKGGRARL